MNKWFASAILTIIFGCILDYVVMKSPTRVAWVGAWYVLIFGAFWTIGRFMNPRIPVETQYPAPLDDPRRGCQLAGPGRGDCEHFVGLPEREDHPGDVDEYGRPHGWCQVCWLSELLKRAYAGRRS